MMNKAFIVSRKRTAFVATLFALILVVGCATPMKGEQKEAAAVKKTAPAAATDAAKEQQMAEAVARVEQSPIVTEQQPAQVETAPEPAVARQPAPALSPSDPRSVIYLGSDGKLAGTGDPRTATGTLTKYVEGTHAQALTLPTMPKDKYGLVDWIAMVDNGIIKPAGSLDVTKPDIPPFDMNVEIKAKGDFVKDVIFRHKTHTYWLGCENCHTGIFQMAKGANHMTMAGIVEGKWCGRCHGKVSFPLADCNRCHVKEKE